MQYDMDKPVDEIIFIHHGGDHFDKEIFTAVVNETTSSGELAFDKPSGGFWSTIDIPGYYNEWEVYCRQECEGCDEESTTSMVDSALQTGYLKCNFKFKVKPGSKIYIVKCPEDVWRLPGRFRFDRDVITLEEQEFMNKVVANFYKQYYIDFEKMISDGYDGILVYYSLKLRHVLYSWDVTSLLVFNPDIIVEL